MSSLNLADCVADYSTLNEKQVRSHGRERSSSWAKMALIPPAHCPLMHGSARRWTTGKPSTAGGTRSSAPFSSDRPVFLYI